jgi:hypothetical protein
MHIAYNADRRKFTPRALDLAQLLHDWDPIGVYEGEEQSPSPDEYDDLVSPILAALRENPDWESLAGQLRQVLTSDYGLSHIHDVDDFAKRVVAWSNVSQNE